MIGDVDGLKEMQTRQKNLKVDLVLQVTHTRSLTYTLSRPLAIYAPLGSYLVFSPLVLAHTSRATGCMC